VAFNFNKVANTTIAKCLVTLQKNNTSSGSVVVFIYIIIKDESAISLKLAKDQELLFNNN